MVSRVPSMRLMLSQSPAALSKGFIRPVFPLLLWKAVIM